MYIEQRWENDLKNIDSNLYFNYNDKYSLLEVRHKVPYQNLDRRLFFISNPDGSFKNIDAETINVIKHSYNFEDVYKYKENLADYYLQDMKKKEKAKDKERQEQIDESIDEELKAWTRVTEEFRAHASPAEVRGVKRQQQLEELERSKRPFYY